ncbi:tripartite tricarboxylate transporter TctB family protein [Modicisalibacter ilicicola]|uniref:tripartite tricarboxylate transporter TctB family protein n=1 Tax=Modicisalibacter ilicicola TaxID=480814 RepID=UPI0009323545|nr:tripartite tricarboxylate transporter TctB family protein [Halomonas ilicicola]
MDNSKTETHHRRPWLNSTVTVFIILMGIAWAALGFLKYGFWFNNGPGAGFFPAVAGTGVAILGTFSLLRSPPRNSDTSIKNLWPAIAMALTIITIPLLGMIPSMVIFIILWMAVIEQKKWMTSLITGIGAGVVVYLLFGLWLKVAFPQGLLLEMTR